MIAVTSISGRRWSEGADQDDRTCRADLIESFRMGARDMLGVGHVDNVDHCANDVLHSRAGLGQRVCNDRQCGPGLHVGIAAELRRAGGCTGHKDLVSNADGSRVSVRVFKRVTG
jgi:hypothetical protein